MRDLKKLENELRFAADAGCDYTLLLEAADALAEVREWIEAQKAGTIYIVTAGEYSDYGIIAATKDKATAERIKNKYNRAAQYDRADIEEYDDAISEHEMTIFRVEIKNGEISYSTAATNMTRAAKEEVRTAKKYDDYQNGKPNGTSWIIHVIAKSEGTARKIAKDYVMQKEAEAQGI